MEYGLIIGGMLLAFVIASLYQHFQSRQKAQTLLERAHLLEIGKKLKILQEELKQGYDPASPPVIKTSKELIISYLRSEDENIPIFLHNFSILNPKYPWTSRVQIQLVSYICNLVSSSSPNSVQYSNTDILHFCFMFDTKEEHEQFLSTSIEIPEFPRAFLQLSPPITIEKIQLSSTKESTSDKNLSVG